MMCRVLLSLLATCLVARGARKVKRDRNRGKSVQHGADLVDTSRLNCEDVAETSTSGGQYEQISARFVVPKKPARQNSTRKAFSRFAICLRSDRRAALCVSLSILGTGSWGLQACGSGTLDSGESANSCGSKITVNPGDSILASITLTSGQWKLTGKNERNSQQSVRNIRDSSVPGKMIKGRALLAKQSRGSFECNELPGGNSIDFTGFRLNNTRGPSLQTSNGCSSHCQSKLSVSGSTVKFTWGTR